jgi:phosphoglycerate dehydrogenase-like enzyme
MNIFVTIPDNAIRHSFLTEKAVEALSQVGTVTFTPTEDEMSPKDFECYAKDADVLVTGWGTIKINENVIPYLPNLKIIAHTGAAVTHIVDDYAYQKGIAVLSGNDLFAKSVAEGCLCYTLTALRHIEEYAGMVRKGGWRNECFFNEGIFGRKVGFIGFGAIAKYFLQMLKPFEVDVRVYSGHMSAEEAKRLGVSLSGLTEIFEQCDIISVHSSLTPNTVGMITADMLAKIQDGALLVNTARGEIIDEGALITQLKTGRFHAVLDVFAQEPLPIDSPLRTLSNVLPIPHMGGITMDMRQQVTIALSKDIDSFKNGGTMKNSVQFEHFKRMTK